MLRVVILVVLAVSLSIAGMATRAVGAPSEIGERWDFYFNRINGQPASVLVDLGLKAHAPLKKEPTLLWVLLPMQAPDQHGMGTEDEVRRMAAIEAEVSDRLSRALKARNVGRIRGEGQWQLYYYAATDKGMAEALKKALSGFPKQKAESGSKPDPKWALYEKVLYPSAERRQWMKDRDVVDALAKMGDDGTTPRNVRHWAMFPDVTSRKAFEAAVTKHKFVIDERTELMDDKFPHMLRLQRTDAVDLESIHATAELLRKAALAVGGTYDGWEAKVVTKKPSKPK